MTEILIFCRIKKGALTRTSLEGLGAGCRLAQATGDRLAAVVTIEKGEESLLNDLILYGAHKVYAVYGDFHNAYYPEYGLNAVETLCRRINPRIILFMADADGREIAPRLAYRLDAGIVTECIDLEAAPESDRVHAVKPVYGGKALARYTIRNLQVLTLREHAFDALERAGSPTGEIEKIEIGRPAEAGRIAELEFIEDQYSGIKLEEASIVVAGGRGIGGKEQFTEVEQLAKIFGGAPAASRAAVDAGWAPPSCQVGQTGKIIAPNLYVAVGISGASQHLAGMSRSKCIVAINKDPDAPIFRAARYGIVEDYRKVLPILKDRVKEMLTG